MTPFEKEYKERFKDANSLEEVEPNAIWDNISNALPEEEGDKRGALPRKWYGLLGVLLLVALGAGLFMRWSNATENAAAFKKANQNDEQILVPNYTDEHSKPMISNDALLGQSAAALENTEAEFLNNNTSSTTNNIILLEEAAPSVSPKVAFSNNQNPKTNTDSHFTNNVNTTSKKSEAHTKHSPIPSEPDPAFANAKQESTNNAINEITTTSSQVDIANTTVTNRDALENNNATKLIIISTIQSIWLPTLSNQRFLLASDKNDHLDKTPTIPQTNKGRNRKLQLALTTGVIARSDRYSNTNLGNILKETSSMASGQSLSLQVQWELAKQVYLTTGLEWLQAQTRFDYISQWDTLAVVRGYETFGEIDAIATRTVRQHNKQSVVTLPLLIGAARNFGALKLGLDAGLGLNYICQQKGKTLNEEQVIVEYDSKNNNILPNADFYLSYQIEPYLSYSLTERFGLRLKPTLRYQQHGTSQLYEQKTSSFLWGLSAGAVLGF